MPLEQVQEILYLKVMEFRETRAPCKLLWFVKLYMRLTVTSVDELKERWFGDSPELTKAPV